MRTVAVHLLFALSGAAGLIFQVTWVRAFAPVFGGSVPSASMVTASFLAGLGLGGWWAGRWADRHPDRLLRAWGAAELLVAALGVAVLLVTPGLLPLSAALSAYGPTPQGWSALTAGSHLARAALVATVLLPPSCAMGATLTLLVRHEVDDPKQAGRRVGWLYGANTAGAAVGAALADTALVPTLGLTATQLVAAGLDATVGLSALALGRRPSPSLPPAPSVDATPAPRGLQLALFLAGLSAMGLEMVWFRFLGGALGPYRAVFSLLLATVLVGQALGASLAGELHRRVGRPAALFAGAQSLLVLSALGALATFDPYALAVRQHAVAPDVTVAGPWARAWLLHQVNGVTILGLVALPSVAMGAAFPLGNALGQRHAERVGRAVGGLYLATTLGNVTGSLLTGFVLLPGPGLQTTTLLLAIAALLAPLAVARRPAALGALVPGLTAVAAFLTLPAQTLLWATFPHGRARDEPLLEVREGLEQILVVTGTAEGPARLWTSGHPMTSTTPHAQRYMRAMAHVPLLLREAPREVLVICVGAGNTVHAATLHPSVERVDAVDLSADVLAVNHHFGHSHHGVLQHPKVHPHVNDGRHHLLLQPEGRYDLITLEPPPLAVAGVSSLYSRDFYRLAASRLASDGIVSQWLPAYQVPESDVRALVRAFVDVFPEAVLLMGSGRELVLLGSRAPLAFDLDAVAQRLGDRAVVQADLERLGLGTVPELVGLFAADRETLVNATRAALPISDDRPFLESAQPSHLIHTRLPPDLFAPRRVGRWAPASDQDPTVRRVTRLTERLFATEAFLTYRSAVPDRTSVLPAPDLSPETLDTITRSASLTRLLVVPDALALRAAELWEQGDREAARRHLATARAQAPGFPLWDEIEASWAAP